MTVFLTRLGIGGWAQILMIAGQDPMSLKKVKAVCNWVEAVECLMRICLTGQPEAVVFWVVLVKLPLTGYVSPPFISFNPLITKPSLPLVPLVPSCSPPFWHLIFADKLAPGNDVSICGFFEDAGSLRTAEAGGMSSMDACSLKRNKWWMICGWCCECMGSTDPLPWPKPPTDLLHTHLQRP